MKEIQTEQIRNIAIIAHGSAGKTSLTEAVLFNAGAVNRLGKVEEGNTVMDFLPEEISRQISSSSATALASRGPTGRCWAPTWSRARRTRRTR